VQNIAHARATAAAACVPIVNNTIIITTITVVVVVVVRYTPLNIATPTARPEGNEREREGGQGAQ
jgi:hypothetical protein